MTMPLVSSHSGRLAEARLELARPSQALRLRRPSSRQASASFNAQVKQDDGSEDTTTRRRVMAGMASVSYLCSVATPKPAHSKSNNVPMEALKDKDYGKPIFRYPDYTMTPSGLQYKDLKEGTGDSPGPGSTVVVDWDGYTIGYYGRPFEARNKAKGGSFTGDTKDFFRFTLGERKVIPAFEEAVASMKPGGIRRIIVPSDLGYPDNDYGKAGPRPTTFSEMQTMQGERALDFVLKNKGLIDKTLLFDIELVKII